MQIFHLLLPNLKTTTGRPSSLLYRSPREHGPTAAYTKPFPSAQENSQCCGVPAADCSLSVHAPEQLAHSHLVISNGTGRK